MITPALREAMDLTTIGIDLDAEVGIVDKEVRTPTLSVSMFWNTFKAIRTGKPCGCRLVSVYYTAFPKMMGSPPQFLPPMCAKCYGDLDLEDG